MRVLPVDAWRLPAAAPRSDSLNPSALELVDVDPAVSVAVAFRQRAE